MKADHICSTVCVSITHTHRHTQTHTQTVTPRRTTNNTECHDPVNTYHPVILKLLVRGWWNAFFTVLLLWGDETERKANALIRRVCVCVCVCVCVFNMQINIESIFLCWRPLAKKIVTEWFLQTTKLWTSSTATESVFCISGGEHR